MGTKANPGKFDCYNYADEDEPMFVLLARDVHAAGLVRRWANEYMLRKLAEAPDRELPNGSAAHRKADEAMHCAAEMDRWRTANCKD